MDTKTLEVMYQGGSGCVTEPKLEYKSECTRNNDILADI